MKNTFSFKLKNHIQQTKNPWMTYMQRFDVPEVHKSGVKEDLGGIAKKGDETYYFPYGKCPVFGKILSMKLGGWFSYKVNAPNLNKDEFYSNARTGDFPKDALHTKHLGATFPKVTNETSPYTKWISPIEVSSAYVCAQYANMLENPVVLLNDNINCFKKKGVCIKQPAIYDFVTQMCYILYPLRQSKKMSGSDDYLYKASKSSSYNSYAYITSNLKKDWQQTCPTKPLKGVSYGEWVENECKKIEGKKVDGISFEKCGYNLFDESPADDAYENGALSRGIGYNWGTYIADNNNFANSSCYIYNVKPTCLIYEPNAVSFTSLGMYGLNYVELPPCIPESKGWKIEANCVDKIDKNYTCNENLLWAAEDGTEIKNCTYIDSWVDF